jgi:hypothetical protein
MTEKLKALCIEGYCISASVLDARQRHLLGPLDRNDDGFVTVAMQVPEAEDAAGWITAPDDPDVMPPKDWVPVDVSAREPAATNVFRKLFGYRSFVDPVGLQRFHLYHIRAGADIIHDYPLVIDALPTALAELRPLGIFPPTQSAEIAVLIRPESAPMRLESRPAFGGKCGAHFSMPILGLTSEFLDHPRFPRVLKHELAHVFVHSFDGYAPRWLSEAAASHAEQFDPARGPLDRLQLPDRLQGQWRTPFEALTWERARTAEEIERYQICHAFFLFIEHRYGLGAIQRFYAALRTSGPPALGALLRATGEEEIAVLQVKFRRWLAQRIASRQQALMLRRAHEKKICRVCREKPQARRHSAPPPTRRTL